MNPRLLDGWIVIDYDGDPHRLLHLAIGDVEDQSPAYRDRIDGRPVLKVRPPVGVRGRVMVWLVVDGVAGTPQRLTL